MVVVCVRSLRQQRRHHQQNKARCSLSLHPFPTYRATAAEADIQVEFKNCSDLGKHFFCLCILHPLFAVAAHDFFFIRRCTRPAYVSLCVDVCAHFLSAALLPLSTVALPSERGSM